MRDFFDRRYAIRQNWVFILGVLLSVYFSYHLLQGERSYIRLIGLNQAIARETAHAENLVAAREELTKKVEMLRPGSMNRDFLEERARTVLGYRTPDDMDVILKK